MSMLTRPTTPANPVIAEVVGRVARRRRWRELVEAAVSWAGFAVYVAICIGTWIVAMKVGVWVARWIVSVGW